MRERSELARKGIARGRSVVALAFAGGVLFVAENPSRSLQKISELYDRVGFAAAGKFNEFDNLRRGGIQFADTRGYAYDRRDVTGRQLAYVYAQTLGSIFTEQAKPYEVELCVAEVAHYGETKPPELYRITYDGSIADEPHFVVMGGTTEPITNALKESYTENADLTDAIRIAVEALRAGSASADSSGNGQPALGVASLEVAILDAKRPRRAFRRITGAALETLLRDVDPKAKGGKGAKASGGAKESRIRRRIAGLGASAPWRWDNQYARSRAAANHGHRDRIRCDVHFPRPPPAQSRTRSPATCSGGWCRGAAVPTSSCATAPGCTSTWARTPSTRPPSATA